MYIYVYIYIYIHIYTYVYIYIYVNTYILLSIHLYIYIQYIHTYVYIHMYTQLPPLDYLTLFDKYIFCVYVAILVQLLSSFGVAFLFRRESDSGAISPYLKGVRNMSSSNMNGSKMGDSNMSCFSLPTRV